MNRSDKTSLAPTIVGVALVAVVAIATLVVLVVFGGLHLNHPLCP